MAAAFNANGATSAAQLYTPYGSVRYTSGAMPTDYGYTGQRADAATGLDYYGARYYDPAGLCAPRSSVPTAREQI